MITFTDNVTGKLTFVAHGQGVIVREPDPKSSYRDLRKDYLQKRTWCIEQGWKEGKDFMLPGRLTNARWFFKNVEQQVLFSLRWA